jgi:hypothetical protein
MSDTSPAALDPAERALLNDLWNKAATKITDPSDPAKAPAFGLNFRVNVREACVAVFHTATTALKLGIQIHKPFDLLDWVEIGVDAVNAIRSVISAIVEQLAALDYITYVILGQQPDGMERDELKSKVGAFMTNPAAEDFAWYLGMSRKRAALAQEAYSATNWFEQTIKRLTDKNYVSIANGTRFKFEPRNFVSGWREE